MWAARDKDGTLNLFSEKPVRIDNDDDMWLSFVWHQENVHTCKRMRLDSSEFPYLKWEDEPVEVKLVPQSADVIKMPNDVEIGNEMEWRFNNYDPVPNSTDYSAGFGDALEFINSKIVK